MNKELAVDTQFSNLKGRDQYSSYINSDTEWLALAS